MPAGRPAQFCESDVLDRAMDFFWTRGYVAGSMADLVDHVGVGRQSLYNTFGSKRDLFLRVITHYRATQLSRALEILSSPDRPPLDNVRRAVDFFQQLALDERARGCLVANSLIEVGADDPELASLLRETLALLEGGFETALNHARTARQLSSERNPRQLARALTNAVVGLAVMSRLGQPKTAVKDVYHGTLAMLD